MWTLSKTADVRGCVVREAFDPAVVARETPEATRARRLALARRLKDDVKRTHDVDLDLRDVAFSETVSDGAGTLRCWWRPETHGVELVGGPADGMQRMVQVVGVSLRWGDPAGDIDYDLIGWDPNKRMWRYGVVPPG